MSTDQMKGEIYQHFKKSGFNTTAIAAIMANIDVQTGGTFDYQTKQKGGNGYGLFQFDYLKKYYNSYLTDNKVSDSIKSQIDFMASTIKGTSKNIIGAGNANKIMTAFNEQNLTMATKVFCELWEKPGVPHLDRRLKSAQTLYKRIEQFNKNRQQQVTVKVSSNGQRIDYAEIQIPCQII